MAKYEVVDVYGKVVATFPSKNQAEKFKKQCNASGKFGCKVLEKKEYK